jgi:hypothetical protein
LLFFTKLLEFNIAKPEKKRTNTAAKPKKGRRILATGRDRVKGTTYTRGDDRAAAHKRKAAKYETKAKATVAATGYGHGVTKLCMNLECRYVGE